MVVLSTKVTDEFKTEITKIASECGKTTSELLRLCLEEIVYGRYRVDGEHLRPSAEYQEVIVFSEVDQYRDEADRLIAAMEKKGYNVSRKLEELTQMVSESTKGTDWGA